MSQSPDKVYEAARDLSQELTRKQRVELAHELLDTLVDEDVEETQEEVAKAWHAAVLRRSQNVREGKSEVYSGEEVARRAQELLDRRRKK